MRQLLQALCGGIAAVALFAIMALTLADVGSRKLLAGSLPGSLELTELLMVAVIFAGLPLVSLQAEHVVFDSLDARTPRRLLRVQRSLVDILCGVLMAGMAWLMWDKAGQVASYGDITAQLKLPVAPVVYAMSLLCGLTAAIHVVLGLRPEPGAADDDAAGPVAL